MSLFLRHKKKDANVAFTIITQNGDILGPEDWSTHWDGASPEVRRGMHILMLLLEEEQAAVTEDDSIIVNHSTIADIDEAGLASLGLPPAAPFALAIEGQGIIAKENFRFAWWLLDGHKPIVAPKVTGVFLTVGTKQYTLTNPLYQLITGMEQLNAVPSEDMDARYLRWAELAALLPEDAVVHGHLKNIKVVRGTAFALRLSLDENDEVTFDPELVYPVKRPATRGKAASTDTVDETEAVLEDPDAAPQKEDLFTPALAPAQQKNFAEQFRRYRSSQPRYVLRNGWYVMVDKPLQQALEVVRQAQMAPPEQRRAFAANPYPILHRELAPKLSELMNIEQGDEKLNEIIDRLFFEDGDYSKRVTEIGLWQPPEIPWVEKKGEEWLPPEGERTWTRRHEVWLDAEDLSELEIQIEEALEAGQEIVEFKGQKIPVNEEMREALAQMTGQASWSAGLGAEDGQGEASTPKGRLVLLIKDNLGILQYKPPARRHRPGKLGIPNVLSTRLKPHQVDALNWLIKHWQSGSPGVLLADDMGLGKTLQALAFLAWLKDEMEAGYAHYAPMLIVAPTGLLKNWEDEHNQHLSQPGLGFLIRAYGPGLRELKEPGASGHQELEYGIPLLNQSKLEKADWVLTTYETLRNYQHSFGRIRWAAMVCDEAQKVKTPGTLVTNTVKAMNAEFVIMMTGTPVENRLADLWCIMDSAQPGFLGDLKSFSAEYEAETAGTRRAVIRLKQKLDQSEPEPRTHPKPMLRRHKADHLDGLPEKHEHLYREPMPPLQMDAYNFIINEARKNRGLHRGAMLEAIHQLRNVSLHPFFLNGNHDFASSSDQELISNSARLRVTIQILDNIKEAGEKALVFLESRELQPVLQGLLQRRYGMKSPPLLINGTVEGAKRKRRVDAFQERLGFDVMILSPKAGGVGLTLTAANHVIHLSRWWNPAVEDQCTDRIYRIGQEKDIHVYFPIAVHPELPEHSFDERLHSLLERKRELSRTLLVAPAATVQDAEELYIGTVGQH